MMQFTISLEIRDLQKSDSKGLEEIPWVVPATLRVSLLSVDSSQFPDL